ncbi:MAG: response regulator [Drouetiella hepatica Uher 2000/2452]|jgi:CheY-like chemotaxis protein|uniref:Response regulator n=1 Tax=Drouetiella hepatica Uher 2000/2452 TaxID=904376 RepID=A0A951Q727_9CYAN|nr:response regulator [Drouetiella hepatica Uher 2000/2452]
MYRVLVVDDIDDNAVFLQTLLETEGYAVETAAGGWAAIRQIKACCPDLILLDVMMPDMVGYEVIERVRTQLKLSTVPVVLLTAYNDISRKEALEMGANFLMRKPIDNKSLLDCVKKLCDSESHQQESHQQESHQQIAYSKADVN